MKRVSSLVALATLIFAVATPPSFGATNRVGGTCKTLNQTVKIGAVSATCAKIGSKLIWKRIVTPPKAASKSASPSAASQSPSTPVKPSSSPAIATQSAYEITVNSGSWFFNFSYSLDGVKGGLKSEAAKAKVLFLPAGKLVQLTLTNSSDVAHGFWIPELLIDKEILPGNKAKVEFTPDKLGRYSSSCNISCGRGHATMTFSVEVVSEADYLKYLSGLKP